MQQHSSNISQPVAIETGQSEEPQYEDIELSQAQQRPAAGQYDSLSPQTQGEQHQYEVFSPQKDKDYVDIM